MSLHMASALYLAGLIPPRIKISVSICGRLDLHSYSFQN